MSMYDSITTIGRTQLWVTRCQYNLRIDMFRGYLGRNWTRGVQKRNYWSFDERFLRFWTIKTEQREKHGYKKRQKTWVFTCENGRYWTLGFRYLPSFRYNRAKRGGGCKYYHSRFRLFQNKGELLSALVPLRFVHRFISLYHYSNFRRTAF